MVDADSMSLRGLETWLDFSIVVGTSCEQELRCCSSRWHALQSLLMVLCPWLCFACGLSKAAYGGFTDFTYVMVIEQIQAFRNHFKLFINSSCTLVVATELLPSPVGNY